MQAGAAALNFFPGAPIPSWLSEDDKSRLVTTLAVLLFVAPLCLVKELRQVSITSYLFTHSLETQEGPKEVYSLTDIQ